MTEIRVIKKFYDIKAKADRLPGETFEADEARARYIDEALPGYIEFTVAKTAEARKAEGPADESANLAKKTVAELTAIARERGIAIPAKPKKAELLMLLKG